MRRSIAIEKLLVENGLELPTDEDVRKFYDDNQKKFTRPPQVHAKHILARVKPNAEKAKWDEAKKRVQKLRKKIVDDGAKFSKLAKENSDGPSAKKGGDVGFIAKKQFDKDFTDAAFKLEKNQVSKPVKTKYGWHLIKVVDRRESKTVPFEKVKARLAKQLKNRKIQKRLKSYIAQLRKEAEIEKHPENVE